MSGATAHSVLDAGRAADVLVRDYMAVRSDEVVLITADTNSDMTVVHAALAAAARVGAKAATMIIPQLPFQGRLADPYVTPALTGAALNSDVWIDLTFPYLAGSAVHDQAMKTKRVRYLLGGDMGSGGLIRLFGRVDLDSYYAVHEGFDALMNEAIGQEVRITNDLGSDIRFRLAERAFTKPRRGDRPGSYMVPGACTMFPDPESVRGIIRVGSIFHEYYTALATPLTLEIDGKIRKLSGGGGERKVADRALRRAAGGDYGCVIHFTHGIHPAARVTGLSFIEDMRVTGNDAVGLGLPWWTEGGGENHPDAVLHQQSIWLDDRCIVEEGMLVDPPDLAKLAEKLVPLYG